MKRLYTCVREVKDVNGKSFPEISEMNHNSDVMKWIKEHGVDVHENGELSDQRIHKCRDGSWALIFCNGVRVSLERDIVMRVPTSNVMISEEQKDDNTQF